MKRIISLAVIGIIAAAGNVRAQTIKEDFDNGAANFGIAYSARYDTKLPENYTSHYRFTTEDSQNLLDQGEVAKKVSLYYVDAKPWFVYNETDGLYYRYEFGDKQIDGSTGEQLAVKNIILQNCYSSLKDSKNGTLDIDYLSGGSGMYITNGKAVPITWKRASANDITHYYTQDGQEIILNPGKTWVEIVENSRASQNKISAE